MSDSIPTHPSNVVSTSPSGDDQTLGEILETIIEQIQSGQLVDVEDWLHKHPTHEARLRQLWPTIQTMVRFVGHQQNAGTAIATAIEDAEQEGVLGEFRIIREIGRGGMGVVYEATQLTLGRRVALKVMPFAAILAPRQLERFKNEAKAAATLHHTNIVPVYSVGCDRGVYYYAMQYIDGCSLASILDQLRRMQRGKSIADSATPLRSSMSTIPSAQEPAPTADAELSVVDCANSTHPVHALSTEWSQDRTGYFRHVARLGIDAAEALEHAHFHGIVHRDIKPANLLLDVDGRLWVTDFGLARLETDVGMTLTGDVLGTLRYMSPEQARGDWHTIDPRSDVYSLGATLYELLTLRPVFTSQDRAKLLQQITEQEPVSLRSTEHRIPQDFETIVLKALQKQPEDRYASARQLADDLTCFLDEKPIHATRPSVLRRAAKWTYRHRGLVATAIVTLFAALAMSSVFLWHERNRSRSALVQSEVHRQQAEANLEILTGLAGDLGTLGHDHREIGVLRDGIQIQERVLESLTNKAAEAEILLHLQNNYAHLAEVLKTQGQLDEARQACAEFWQIVERRDALTAGDNRDNPESFRDFAVTSADLGDGPGAQRACIRAIRAAHKGFQQPENSDRSFAARALGEVTACGVTMIETRVPERECLIREYAKSVDAARQFLRKNRQPPVDDKQAEQIALVQGYLANVARLQGQVDEAVAWYRQAFRSLPETQATPRPMWIRELFSIAALYHNQGRFREEVGLYQEATAQSRICINLDPSDQQYSRNLLIALTQVYSRGNSEESRQACSELLERLRAERQRDPEYGQGQTRILLYQLMGMQTRGPYTDLYDYAEVLECAEYCLNLDPEDECARLYLGMARYRTQDYRGARECLQRVNDLREFENIPRINQLEARMFLALTLKKLGELTKARDYFEQGVTIFQTIDDPYVDQRALLAEAQTEFSDTMVFVENIKNPGDNDNQDLDPAVRSILVRDEQPFFRFSLYAAPMNREDAGRLNLDVRLSRDEKPLQEGTDYVTDIDPAGKELTIRPISGRFDSGSYQIAVDSVRFNVMVRTKLPRIHQLALRSVAGDNARLRCTRVQKGSVFVPKGTEWKYLDDGTDQGTTWREVAFDDSKWKSGPAQLGYGEGDEVTLVGFGPDEAKKYPTTYFRHSFVLGTSPIPFRILEVHVLRDDGVAVFLNGSQLMRHNLNAVVSYRTYAQRPIVGTDETSFMRVVIRPDYLAQGANYLAAEIHQCDATSSDLSFDLMLSAPQIDLVSVERLFGDGDDQVPPGSEIVQAILRAPGKPVDSDLRLVRLLESGSVSHDYTSEQCEVPCERDSAFQIRPTVQAWSDGAENHGWALLQSSEATTGIDDKTNVEFVVHFLRPQDAAEVAWLLATGANADTRDPTSALQLAERAVKYADLNSISWAALGAALYRTERWEEALPALETAERLSDAPAVISVIRAMVEWQLGHHDEALQLYDRVAAIANNQSEDADPLSRLLTEAASLMGLSATER